MSPFDLTASEILKIPIAEPERLFSSADPDRIQVEFKKLAAKWHEDVCSDPKAPEIMVHINILYQEANLKIEKGVWEVPGLLTLKMKKMAPGKSVLQVKYQKHHKFELGDFYICPHSTVYVVGSNVKDLLEAFAKAIKAFKYASDKMKEEMSHYLPKLAPIMSHPLETLDGRVVLVVEKNPDQILLRDLMDHLGGNLDPKHTAWIISNLLHQACYLEYNNQTFLRYPLHLPS